MRKEAEAAPASDGGDFCGFVAGCTPSASPMYVGVPSNAAVCDSIAALGGAARADCRLGLTAARYPRASWAWLALLLAAPLYSHGWVNGL